MRYVFLSLGVLLMATFLSGCGMGKGLQPIDSFQSDPIPTIPPTGVPVVPPPPTPTNHLFFVSSLTYNGNLGGGAGADQKCKDLAILANLRPERPWKAILSTNEQDAKNRVLLQFPEVINTRAVALGGPQKVANSADFWDDPWLASPRYTELGIDAASASDASVWTGTEDNGNSVGGNCANWTSTGTSAIRGRANLSNFYGDRFNIGTSNCTSLLHLYCLSQ